MKFMSTKFLSSSSKPNPHYRQPDAINHYLHISKSIGQLKQTHSLLLKTSTNSLHYDHLLARLLRRLVQFPDDNLCYARNLFDQIRDRRNEFLWTSLVRSHVLHGRFRQSISLYAKMHREGISPSGFTFSSVLNACARIPAILEGRQVNVTVVKSGLLGNKVVQTALLDMYAKCGCVRDARDVFDGMVDKDVVVWTAMIYGYTKMGMMDDARWLFDNMGTRNAISWTTMVAGYANKGDMKAAKELYELMTEKNSVLCVAMIAGYGKCGNVEEARMVFDEVPEHDASCWAAMVVCYAQNGYAKEAIETYEKMRKENIAVNEVAIVGALSACIQLGDVEMATKLAKHVDEERTLVVSNALIHMHSTCGNLDQARKEFDRMSYRDVISYTTLIIALADHGKAKEALELFSKMHREEIAPNQVTFIGVLNACSHAGMIEEGCRYFELMIHVFGIEPLNEHYACMVDLLGRAGLVEKAYNLIMENEDAADAKLWGSLLAACKVHGNAELGEIAAMHLFKIEPENTGNYVLLASIYAEMNKWDDAKRVRKMMSERGIRKSPGRSWI
ncbi:putative pentatricopeptide repeat-containing protein At5g37570 isoform X2 [Ziziphus jujuba]|uniref:Pentatricopeptide repeat-containing protein At5g37570 isoform X2 n=1 Tax=Ziziphus jujuba TaxID=326968 RepID=A0A6P3YR10_ZIZJJ|nr:putative pentatricopeptide repeat-containing protein At5g37570 isoform X2 [Ziziphus jujuba]